MRTCVDVLRHLITELDLTLSRFSFIEHSVAVNWRVLYGSVSKKVDHIGEGLVQQRPYDEWTLLGKDILENSFEPARRVHKNHHVISVSSKVLHKDGAFSHLPMMNLHPDDALDYSDVISIVEAVTEGMPGYLLRSGRHYHFYGISLLSGEEWMRFLSQFCMPTIIVSPRYIGHCLYRGYTALRLTADTQYKPLIPTVCGSTGRLRAEASK